MSAYPPGCWRAYFLDQGETADSARQVFPATRSHLYTADDAARQAVEMDWDNSGGEAGIDRPMTVVVISPTGEETRWRGVNESMIVHRAYPDDET